MSKAIEIVDLVIVFALMCVCVSFFTILMMKLDSSEMHYLKDKTVHEFSELTEEEAIQKIDKGFSVNGAQVYLTMAVQDNYCPYVGIMKNANESNSEIEYTDKSYWRSIRMNTYAGNWKKANSLKGFNTQSKIFMRYYHTNGLNTGKSYWEFN